MGQLEPKIARRIPAFLHDRVATLDGPGSIGQTLKGSKPGEPWKYRIGDYRIISGIADSALRILVAKIGNRREVYR